MKLTFSIEYWSPSGVCAGDVDVTCECDGGGDDIQLLDATVSRNNRPFPLKLLEGRCFAEEVAEAAQGAREYAMDGHRDE